MKTAWFYLDTLGPRSTSPFDVFTMTIDVVDPDEPNRITLVFCGDDTTKMREGHALYEALQTGMLPPGHVFCRSWERAEVIVRDFLQQAGCPVDQIGVRDGKHLYPDNFHMLFGWKDPGDVLAEVLLEIIRKTNRPTLRERIRDLYYRICAFLA